MYGMTNYVKIFVDELTNCIMDESGSKQSQCKISIYYRFAPYGSRLVVLSYVDEYVYWYIYEELGKWFVDTLGKIFNAKFLGYSH